MTLQSRKTIEGPSRARHRAMYKAMGLHDADLDKPLIEYPPLAMRPHLVIFILES
jgi:dihydroxyacid dehydratase/phosphogluconate dehydratase